MKINYLCSLLCSLFLFGTAQLKAQSPTAAALNFNAMVLNNAQFNSSEMEGPLAVGNKLTISGDYNVNIHNKSTYFINGVKISLVVNGTVDFNSGNSFQVSNGYVKIGDCGLSKTWYTDPNNATPPIRITKDVNYNSTPAINLQNNSTYFGVSPTNNPVCESTTIDFQSAFQQFKTNAQSLSTCTDNAVLKTSNGVLLGRTNLPNQVKIYLQPGANILNITGADLNSINNFIFEGSQANASSFLIVNIDNSSTGGVFNWTAYNVGGFGGLTECKYMLYNFYNTTQLNITNNSSAIEGTVFAPYAAVEKNNYSNLEGQVIAQSFKLNGGGEIHYAVFEPSYSGCGIPAIPTVSQFSLNSAATQCLSGNSYTFFNTSTGDGSLDYNWDFGDSTSSILETPTKIYSTPGTYTISLTVTGLGGSTTSTSTVTILSSPHGVINVSDTLMDLSSNSFSFSVDSIHPSYTYTWDFKDGTSSIGSSVTKVYSIAGPYNVELTITNASGCDTQVNKLIYVVSDSVGSGGDGGLESESLGGLVSKRDFNRLKYSIAQKIDYAQTPLFLASASRPTGDDQMMSAMIPQELEPGDKLRVTSPEDLLYLTAAKEVISVDYTRNNKAKAVVLAIRTLNKAYSHTKSICDRFKGSELIGVDTIKIKGFDFIRFTLRDEKGSVEYATAFVVGSNKDSSSYTLQTNWLISEYTESETVYNFQVWSAQPAYTNKLVAEIIDNLESFQAVKQTNIIKNPEAYITFGKREKDNLIVYLQNNTYTTNATLVFEERKNEQSDVDMLTVPLQMVKGDQNKFAIRIKDGYEYQGKLYLDSVLVDEVYMADGNWGIDYDKDYTTLVKYSTGNDSDREYQDDEFPLYRNTDLEAISNDYVTIYKAIRSGTEATDLSAYNSLKFIARGTGKVEIKLTKGSITDWKAQYKFMLNLSGAQTEYAISLSDFKSDLIKEHFVADDLKTVSFTFYNTSGRREEINFNIKNMAFSTEMAKSVLGLQSKDVNITPNPNNGQFKCEFLSDQAIDLSVQVLDITGKIVSTQLFTAVEGKNSIPLTIDNPGVFLISIKGAGIKYDTQKVIISK